MMYGVRNRELAQQRAQSILRATLAVAMASNGCVGGSQHSVGAAPSEPKVSDLRAPDASTPIHEREAEIPATGLTLKGTLEIPAGRAGQRFAAVFFGAG